MFTDHKNLTTKNFSTDRVMRWRLLLEEYGPELRYLEGHKNIVTDALSRSNIITSESEFKDLQSLLLLNAECLQMTNYLYQQLDKELLTEAKKNPTNNYSLQQFCGGKLFIPKSLQTRIVQ